MKQDGLTLFVWYAGEMFSGVSDDDGAAKAAAAVCLRRGESARVERCLFASGYRRMSTDHLRTGAGWMAVRPEYGPLVWVPFLDSAEQAS